MTASGPILVIGYGNTLRGDDGAGVVAAARIRDRGQPGVQVILAQQLAPELAEPLAAAAIVFFMDAGIGQAESPVVIAPVCPQSAEGDWTHTSNPGRLLALAETLFGRSPQAWLVTISGQHFTLNEHLSPHTSAAVAEAVALIEDRIARES